MTDESAFDLGQAMAERVMRAMIAEFGDDEMPVFVMMIEPQPAGQGVFIAGNAQGPFDAHRLLSTGLLMLTTRMKPRERQAAEEAWAALEGEIKRETEQQRDRPVHRRQFRPRPRR